MQAKYYFVFFILLGLGGVLSSKSSANFLIRYQQKFNIFNKVYKRKDSEIADLERKTHPFFEISYIVGGLFFILVGVLGLLGVLPGR